MSKKKKCIECQNCSRWALPDKVTDKNIDYAKYCLRIAKKTFVCFVTMKTKQLGHEQYCKYFEKKEHEDTWFQNDLERLERMINEYEFQKNSEKEVE